MLCALTNQSADSVFLCLWFEWTNKSADLCCETSVLLKVKLPNHSSTTSILQGHQEH